jgi:hypothetical protein
MNLQTTGTWDLEKADSDIYIHQQLLVICEELASVIFRSVGSEFL